mmetsp:Transcript_35206/g.64308  ORF Transcript_35206/g.64308 Transcript_35206/m.64308 type:complete len:213 (+) Transcript_35206:78-716(+)
MGSSNCCQNRNGADDALPMVDARPIGGDSHHDEVLTEVPDAGPLQPKAAIASQGDSSPQPPATHQVLEQAPVRLPTQEAVVSQNAAGEAKREPAAEAVPAKGLQEAKEEKEEKAVAKVETEGFIVRVQRQEKKKLGVLVYNRNGEQFIRVRTVQEGGAIAEWNAANPDKQLKPGCHIVDVNGKRTPDDMRNQLNDPAAFQVLTIHVKPKPAS